MPENLDFRHHGRTLPDPRVGSQSSRCEPALCPSCGPAPRFPRFAGAVAAVLALPLWAAWQPIGPFGGSASIVAADPHSPKTFLCGTRNALLFRSRDGGNSWTSIPFPAQLHTTLNVLVVDPQRPGVYLVGLSSDSPAYSGILRSTDAGITWRQLPDLRNQQVRAIAFKRADPRHVAAGTDTGVFASHDGGITWARISPLENAQLRPVMSLTFDSDDPAILYAGTPHLPWKTSDSGSSWNSIHTGMIDDSDIFSIQVDRNRPKRVFAGACSGIYRSLDGADTWTRLVEAGDTSYRTYVILQDPQFESAWFAGTTYGLVHSSDSGATWRKIGPFAARSISFDPTRLGRAFIAADDTGILRSDDNGITWEPVNLGFCNRRLSWLWSADGTVYTSVLEGPSRGSILQLASDLSGWNKVAGMPGIQSLPLAVAAPPWSPELVLAKSESGLFLSEDAGRNWIPLELPLPAERIWAFFALDKPWIAATGPAGVFLSRDARNWKACAPGAGPVYGVVSANGGGLLAATATGLKSSPDHGLSWRAVRGELQTDTIQAICRHPRNPALLFAAKYGRVYASTDAGRSWKDISDSPWPIDAIKQLVVLPGDPDRLLALTPQQGVWVLPLQY